MSFFQEEAFKDIVTQFQSETQVVGDWEFYVKNQEFTVYRKPAHGRNSHLYQYRAIGGWSNVNAETLATVYLDLEFRKKWDKNMLKYQSFLTEEGYDAYHFEMKYPWPLSNRDYVYVIERKIVRDKGQEYQVILGESLPVDSFPSSKGVIRIGTYMQNICITKNEDGKGCHVFMDYFDDPQGNIPKSVINWAAKIAVPSFVENLRAACTKYEQENPNRSRLDDVDIIDIE